MNDSLETYLHDHLAGSHFAVELLESLRDQHGNTETGLLAEEILAEVQQDRELLKGMIQRVGATHFDLKEAAAWISEKVSRMKLNHDAPGGIGTFEALEALTLGIAGKLALWRALPLIAEADSRVGGYDYEKLAERARDQFDRVEHHRLQIARSAFALALK